MYLQIISTHVSLRGLRRLTRIETLCVFFFFMSKGCSISRSAEPHNSIVSVQDSRTGGRWFDPRLGHNSFRGLMIITFVMPSKVSHNYGSIKILFFSFSSLTTNWTKKGFLMCRKLTKFNGKKVSAQVSRRGVCLLEFTAFA